MHERTRRNLCRLAFFALALLPTGLSLCGIAYRCSPWYAAQERDHWERAIAEHTGLIADIREVSYPTGGSVLLSQLTLHDPDGDQLVARVRAVELASRSEGLVILLSQPEVMNGMFLRLWDRLHERVLKGPLPPRAVQLTTGELTLEVGHRAQTFKTVRCTVEPDARGVRAGIEFQLAGREMPAPAQLWIARDRQTSPPVTHWQLKSDVPVPVEIFGDYLPALSRLGSRCEFQGQVAVSLARSQVAADLSGRFHHVDLESLTDPFPYTLRGSATVSIDRAQIQAGVLQRVTGAIDSQGGAVSYSLLASLAEHLPVATPDGVVLAAHNSLTHFDRLGLRFSLGPEGCSVAGAGSPDASEILSSRGRTLLRANSQSPYPLLAVVRALCPDRSFLVPATDELKGVLSWFPLPPAQPNAHRLRLSTRPGK